DVSIDARLIVDVRADTIVLDNGCICCSVRGDLLGALERLMKAPVGERVERGLIEASGIADPRSVLSTFVALDKASTIKLDGDSADYLATLERLNKAPVVQREGRVQIEASGIADPRAVLSTFVALDKASTIKLDGVVAVVDASEVAGLSVNDLSLVRDQLDQS